MADFFCPECKKLTEVVLDHSAGDTICSECGLVLEAHSVDETSEWRNFSNESADNDPVRVGGPYNPLLSDGGLSTVISMPNGGSTEFLSSSLGKWQGRGSNPDKNIIQAFKAIAAMSERFDLNHHERLGFFFLPLGGGCCFVGCVWFLGFVCFYIVSEYELSVFDCANVDLPLLKVDGLGLVTTIKDRANEIYKKVEDQKLLRGRNQDAIMAACLYIACRQENKPRTVKEICSVVNGTTKREIGRAKEFIVKHLELEMGQSMEIGTIHAGDYMRRFCSNLGMTNQEVKAAQEAVQKSEELDIRRSPISIAAAIIYIISQLSDDKKPLKDISVVTRVAEGTIRNSFKDLSPHLSGLIPAWYATKEDIKNLQP
ncbi:hypothetical protein REPUB_Repub07fG0069400 [Reevesia pubescens]